MAGRKDAGTLGGARRRLGRGLESLISSPVRIDLPKDDAGDAPGRAGAETPSDAGSSQGAHSIPVDAIRPNPRQPRQDFDEAALEGLARSIRSAGLMQPIVVRPAREGGYEIVAGERRWRAARSIGLERIPALVRAIDDRTASEWSLVENLQREDLNPIERAEAFRRLGEDFKLTHQEIADRVGLDRSSVTNHLRLCDLDEVTREAVRSGRLGMGHGRALLAITNIEDRRRLAGHAVAREWSVRELERRVRSRLAGPGAAPPAEPSPRTAHLRDVERRLGEFLGTKVSIQPGRRRGAGNLVIAFYDLDQFEGLLSKLGFTLE